MQPTQLQPPLSQSASDNSHSHDAYQDSPSHTSNLPSPLYQSNAVDIADNSGMTDTGTNRSERGRANLARSNSERDSNLSRSNSAGSAGDAILSGISGFSAGLATSPTGESSASARSRQFETARRIRSSMKAGQLWACDRCEYPWLYLMSLTILRSLLFS